MANKLHNKGPAQGHRCGSTHASTRPPRTLRRHRQALALAAAVMLNGALGLGMTLATAAPTAAASSASTAQPWSASTTYATAGTFVTYRATVNGQLKEATFINAWWTQGDAPSFVSSDGPWKQVGAVQLIQPDGSATVEAAPPWFGTAAYVGGSVVTVDTSSGRQCYKAKYWTQGFDPTTAVSQPWETPWEALAACPAAPTRPSSGDPTSADPGNTGNTGNDDVNGTGNGSGVNSTPTPVAPAASSSPPPPRTDKLPPQSGTQAPPLPTGTPIVPPVTADIPPASPVKAPALTPGADLPAQGYAFLRRVTVEDWDWLFPLRSGRYDVNGGTRNTAPFAQPDGSTDTFQLAAFRRAVLEYNAWAKANGYKQFLNEGTLKQQAEEFLVFWAKSSRETSGSWSNAPAPWITSLNDDNGTTMNVWKGGLYWVEEVGYSSRPDGTSPAIGYVDTGSAAFPPAPGRSYHGRGVIQLSWNYNYGAFSRWLYDSGLMRDVITAPDTLLQRPDLVASNGALSILSGIWFWMTPQGQKPSSHDVLYGDMTHISTSGTDTGLPQLRTGLTVRGAATGPVAAGDTTDEQVMAFRIGSIINIVNGGLECNGAASWHNGPPQRVSYYNAYTAYFNQKMPDLQATRVRAATNVWDARVSTSSPEALQSATCFNQKSYYGW
ncbi:glycoside hydrolase family 19 protein [Roseateles terrae]|uniref:Chitodextrinase n=1 Tax=Roseateles terrae TaxID=431060 RepID=A0ABR6GME5_9BURK|nr:glycoside hydrolase family 19 protein [Roseateles terrae]MBB3193283.1 chitodextrinase [Roseateles terrae]OWQ89507.1 hypothetical protein CDN98_02990 [Roseateles terrae]